MAAVIRNSDNPGIPNPVYATPIIPNLMTPGNDPIFLLAGACMNDPLFQKDGLWMQQDVDTLGTTLGTFVDYIIACYGNHRI